VKTRTLLLLALGCGLLIMLAGAALLFQLAGQDDVEPAVPIGEQATVGDMSVVVVDASEASGLLDVTIRIGGVDDADGADGFRLIAAGTAVEPADGNPGACGRTTVGGGECTVRFDVSGVDGSSRVLVYARGDDQARWVLS
jgi:hypothetical protein